mgnify:CR=1 FL=1
MCEGFPWHKFFTKQWTIHIAWGACGCVPKVLLIIAFVAGAFRLFWGEKSNLRRFMDGAICEAVVWPGDIIAERSMILTHISSYILAKWDCQKTWSLKYYWLCPVSCWYKSEKLYMLSTITSHCWSLIHRNFLIEIVLCSNWFAVARGVFSGLQLSNIRELKS